MTSTTPTPDEVKSTKGKLTEGWGLPAEFPALGVWLNAVTQVSLRHSVPSSGVVTDLTHDIFSKNSPGPERGALHGLPLPVEVWQLI